MIRTIEIINICRFREKETIVDKVRCYCHLTGKYRRPALSNYNINVTQKNSIFISIAYHNFIKHVCHLIFKTLVDNKNDKIECDIILKSNEEFISVTYGCMKIIDNYRFLSSSLVSLFKTFVDDSHESLNNLKKEIVNKN